MSAEGESGARGARRRRTRAPAPRGAGSGGPEAAVGGGTEAAVGGGRVDERPLAAARIPDGTYRLQLGPEFRFERAIELLPYLEALGVTDLYLSPIFRSRPGSEHGYDVIDPTEVDPELGGLDGFEALSRAARGRGMGILLDTVPNHMAAAAENPWWSDVLRHGPASRFARYFDIDWEAPAVPEGRLLLPVLGDPFAELLEAGAFSLAADAAGVWLLYGDRRFPIEPGSWPKLLDGEAPGEGGPPAPEAARLTAARIRDAVRDMPPFTEAGSETIRARRAATTVAREALADLLRSEEGRRWVEARLEAFAAPSAAGADRLERLLSRQPYSLAHWHLAAEEINYRRFFDIGDMVAVRADQPEVFEATHALVLRLVAEGHVTGLRIDHIDGLWDPLAYLNRLQRRVAEAALGTEPPRSDGPEEERPPADLSARGRTGFYVVVEKILAPDEELRPDWPVHGTTGYDFLQAVQGVFIDRAGLRRLDAAYRRFTGREEAFVELGRRAKHQVMRRLFGSEVSSLTAELVGLAREDRYARDVSADELEAALREVIARLPVYRTYVRSQDVSDADRAIVERAVDAAVGEPGISEVGLGFLRRLLTLENPPAGLAGRWLRFVMRWQQVTGPVTAKGLEDTSLYRYNRLVALNEVGSDPDDVASLDGFHHVNERRLRSWPHTLNATTTHDTKRSEDVRARLNALTELSAEWEAALEAWSRIVERHRRTVDGERPPDRNEEVLIYQTLLGAWPLEDARADDALRERLEGYLRKALREAKVHTSWRDVNSSYEEAVLACLQGLVGDEEFLESFGALRDRVARLGAMNALGQALLTLASPGVPDCYRGTELWDFSLVDPDNRRPVDFELRRRLLEELDRAAGEDRGSLAEALAERWEDGRVKLWLTAEALRLREREPELFRFGGYHPVRGEGPRAAHVCAFVRRHAGRWALVAVPRLAAGLLAEDGIAAGGSGAWRETALRLPPGAPERWRHLYSGRRIRSGGAERSHLPVAPLFDPLPFALLLSGESRGRSG